MPSFADSIFLFVLALLLFGPKKLPVLARELGKWMGEFRRASNEFKMQMEEELRQSEQADRQKQIAAMEAAAPVAPVATDAELDANLARQPSSVEPHTPAEPLTEGSAPGAGEMPGAACEPQAQSKPEPLPIATSGSLRMMPPETGLPTPRASGRSSALSGLVESIPADPAQSSAPQTVPEPESLAHGD